MSLDFETYMDELRVKPKTRESIAAAHKCPKCGEAGTWVTHAGDNLDAYRCPRGHYWTVDPTFNPNTPFRRNDGN